MVESSAFTYELRDLKNFYRIETFIGQGGYGKVYKVSDLKGNHFAAKIMDFSKLNNQREFVFTS